MNTGLAFIFFFWIIAPILYCEYCDLVTHSDTNDTNQSRMRTILLTSPSLPRVFSIILEHIINPQTSSLMASLIVPSMRHILLSFCPRQEPYHLVFLWQLSRPSLFTPFVSQLHHR
jgi:hypothetical protein